ncbi:geranyltranstransferase [Gonapodya prolifera JEL478]|uniref:Geranyltranstransferase n=1 Tax=Gonapodya prolifera (strain JEL478) TaxID=1344416 RepID=A0A139AIB9_GONPJ|nr:geranyltranstransferase [Gonapodya prolifera JEL478]|eukprot:KXS16561.1 geranyltranstransferase [Gonapodya prolifera JEL478]
MPPSNGLDTKKDFMDAFETIAGDILSELHQEPYALPESGIKWIKENLYYNIPGGKMNRGLSVPDTLECLVGQRELSKDERRRAVILGWCVEILQAFFLIADDIMDGSITRRGQPCWYKKDGVGMVAINDSFILESIIYKLLRKYFRQEKYYVDLLELFHEVTYQTELGQMLDLITAPEGQPNLSAFSMLKYKWIVKFKTAFYSFYLPVALAMHMAHITDPAAFKLAESILLPLGEYFQAQDDYLDCYGDPAVIGKIGTDIEDNKCGWIINQALERVSDEQRRVLEDNYARKDPACVARVKGVFNEVNMKQVFADYEEASYKQIKGLIASADSILVNPEVFERFLQKVYKRQK